MRCLSLIAVLVLTVALAAADRPHQATITLVAGDPLSGFILSETIDGIDYSQDEQGQQRIQLKWDKVIAIAYEPIALRDYFAGKGAENRGAFADAAAAYAKAVQAGSTQHEKAEAYKALVRMQVKAGQPAAALASAKEMAKAMPRHRELLATMVMAADALLNAGDSQAAAAAYDSIASLDLGSMQAQAEALATAGKARVMAAEGDHAGAAAAIDKALSKLKPASEPEAYANLAIVAIRAKQQTNDASGAQALAQQIQFIGDAAIQGEAHLVLAKVNQSSAPLVAYDHAVIAALRAAQGAPQIAAEAAALARSLADSLATDDSLTEDQRLALKAYARQL